MTASKRKPPVKAPAAEPVVDVVADIPASEVSVEVQTYVSTSEVRAVTLTLDEYLSKVSVNSGLVASYKCEASLASYPTARTEDEWARALLEQSQRIYE